MNTNNIKKYAPKARREFMDAVAKRLNTFGITANKKGELQIAEANLQGSVLQIAGNSFDGKLAEPRKRIVARSQKLGYAQLIEQVAYTWFNRLCAIRYMEIHDYLGHGFRVLSHPDNSQGAGATNKGRFEIIDHAQDAADELGLDRARIIEVKLAGNKDEELYRELLLGQCHKLHEAMPFLFDALDDETELLLPDNLTRTDSILRGLVDGIPEEDWQQVEVIGWLYQFYISEKKDQVMGKVVKSEDIPAATQLFTPNWIVKYLVQNSVGRQWLQTYPDSAIKTQMEYYIEPAEQSDEVNQQLKAITPESIKPETIKVLDPACGSGHILIEAYNVLKAIYEERGFRSRDIPKMILENNLYGLDIDDRAAQLSGFALMMMARDDDKRIFTRNVRLNVLSLQESNHIDLPTLWKALNLSGSWQSGTSQGLFSDDEQDLSSFNADNRYQLLTRTLARFSQAKTFGSLIDVPSDEHDQLKELLSTLVELQESGDSMQKPAAKQLIEIVHQALVLSIRYDAVIANPPYMGFKSIGKELKDYVAEKFTDGKNDLYSCFIILAGRLTKEFGSYSLISQHSWWFISSYKNLRKDILQSNLFMDALHLGSGAFKEISGQVVQSCAFVIKKARINNEYVINFHSLVESKNKQDSFQDGMKEYCVRSDKFINLDGAQFSYWLPENFYQLFANKRISNFTISDGQTLTGNNDLYLRYLWEVDLSKIGKGNKWALHTKGGDFRKWYGNVENVINWSQEATDFYRDSKVGRIIKEYLWFKKGICWSLITTDRTAFRVLDDDVISNLASPVFFVKEESDYLKILGYLNTRIVNEICNVFNPTMSLTIGDIQNIPFAMPKDFENGRIQECIDISRMDWNSFETAFGFLRDPLLENKSSSLLKETFSNWVATCDKATNRIMVLENENETFFSNYFSLPEPNIINVNQVSLKINFHRLGKTEDESRSLFRSETLARLVSYSLGCVLGRYSLDREGLIWAHSANEGFDKLISEGAYKTFPADEDGIIPFTDQEWFKDDATNRFREFIQAVWGEEHLQENLDFVAESLCLNAIKPKKSESALETIRRYLSTQFYKDHLKTYKKRPIYWLFSSGKQKAFECLVYLHRYNEGTLSRMRTEYVTPLLGKYDAYAVQLEKQIETADSTSEANRFKKELDSLIKKQVELREFDDKLKHYADMRISLDLDDGVKVNYGKFGDLLADVKAITGSEAGGI